MTPVKDKEFTTEVDTVATEDEEAAIPLIEAVPVVAVDNENCSSKNADNANDNGRDDEAPRRVFQVVAPSDLPKGYRLTVITAKNNEEVVILVPPGGVKRNEVFQGKEARPFTKRWSDSEFDCAPNYEGSFCFFATCCTMLGWAFVMRKLGMDPCGRQQTSTTTTTPPKAIEVQQQQWANLTPWVVGVVMLFFNALQPFSCIYFLYLATVARGAVRNKYNIPGSTFCDCMCSACFGCCTLLQSYRHMKRNGDTPCRGGCDNNMVFATQV